MKNNKIYIIIVIIVILALTILGGTYAWWTWTTSESERTNVVFTIEKDFECAADGGGNITSSDVILAPADCTNSNYAIQRELVVTTKLYSDEYDISMDLWLDVLSIDSSLSSSKNFKYAITTSPDSCKTGVVSTGSFNGKTAGTDVLLLDDKTFSKSSTELYYLYVWLDNAETSMDTTKKSFDLTINGSCTSYAINDDLNYNVNNLSNNMNNLDSGFYTLSSYDCDNDSTITFDPYSKQITASNVDKCDLNFTKQSNPKLYDIVEIGDYISYRGNNGCTNPQCYGWNANQTDTDIYDNFGYCYDPNYKFYTYGWRVLHKTDNSVYIVSAGAPECVTEIIENATSIIPTINPIASNYCNLSYLSGGVCDSTTAHAFNGDDFYKFTSQYYGSSNARYLYNYNDGGTYGNPYCFYAFSNQYCGSNNNLINNGGYYWFGSGYAPGATLFWLPQANIINVSGTADTFGVRPVLKLDASILATGGTGTITDPYTISKRTG